MESTKWANADELVMTKMKVLVGIQRTRDNKHFIYSRETSSGLDYLTGRVAALIAQIDRLKLEQCLGSDNILQLTPSLGTQTKE